MLAKKISLLLVMTLIQVFFAGCESVDTPKMSLTGGQDEYLAVMDIDGNVYPTVVIGGQTWMKENLKTTRYRDGSLIADPDGGNCYDYDGNPLMINKFGRLYNWNAVNDARGIAPEGWHVPTQDEWETLIRNLGGDAIAGGKMKESGTEYWANGENSNESGFTALPSGRCGLYLGPICCEDCIISRYLEYWDVGYSAWFWSSEMSSTLQAMSFNLTDGNSGISYNFGGEYRGMSIRCIKD